MKRRQIIRQAVAGLVAAVWLLAGTPGQAASREENQWNAALRYFKEDQWSSALTRFNAFTNDYPASENFSQAVLYLAQAQYHLASSGQSNEAASRPWSFRDAADLLKSQFYRAGPLADQFLLWTAEAEYAGGNYPDAADLYARLARDYDTMRAEALFREAECYYQAKDLPRVIQKLGAPDGAFQQMVKTNAKAGPVAKALFLLTETELALRDYAAATAAVQQLPPQPPGSDLEWKRQYLLVRTAQEAGRLPAALENGTNLLAAAQGNGEEMTRSRMILAKINLQQGQMPEAVSNYEAVLNSDTNAESQRDALLSIVEVNQRSGQLDSATARLDQFIRRYPAEQGSAYFYLLLGELRLRRHFSATLAASANDPDLSQAETNFQAVIQNTNSDLRGKAWLYLGWCWWAEGKVAESGGAFSNAVQLLPLSEDRAVARFKLGDAEYGQKDYADAISNYNGVIGEGGSSAEVTNHLFERALYQILRASTEKSEPDLAAASNAVTLILAWFPNTLLGEPGELLLGQAVARVGSAVEARSCFADFIARWPQSPLRPDVELAIARTYERQHDWTDAVTRYAGWISTWSNSPSLPLAEYSLAWAQFKADDETNAFAGFSSFVEKYPTNELAAQAHNWIGRYHFEREEWGPAEDSFQTACNAKTGATAELKFEAKLMAGRAAWMRQSYRDAANYFRELGSDTNSPEGKRSEAEFALADVQSMSYTATNLSAVKDAIEIYASIGSQPTNELAPAAWGMIAGCYLLLANKTNPACYLDASNYYEKVITATNAGLPIARLPFRCLAEYGIAQTLVGLAGLSPRKSTEWQANLEGAIEHCLVVVNGDNLLVGESSNLREVERSGLEAGRLMEELEHWGDAMKLYETLSAVLDLPSARSALEARMAAVRPHLPARAR